MSAPTNHWKLGLFVVTGVLVGILSLLYLGARSLQKDTLNYTSYFDEAVTGLDPGSPVKFRGVTVGNVSLIDIAPDRRHVAVHYDLDVALLTQLGLAAKYGRSIKISVPRELRVQLGSTGITGVKYLQMDYFDSKHTPLPALPFPVAENYIPGAPSTMKNLEDSVVVAVQRFPELATEILNVLLRINHILEEIDAKKLPERAVATLDHGDQVLTLFGQKLSEIRAGELSNQAHAVLGNLDGTVSKLGRVIERLDGDKGLLASAQRTSDSLGSLTSSTRGVPVELERTLRDISEAAEAVRRLADALEKEPDMLLKGRSARSE